MPRRSLASASSRRNPWRQSQLPLRFQLELLEDRLVPSTFNGIAPAGSLIYQATDNEVAGSVSEVYRADFETGAQGFTADNSPTGGYLPGQWHLSTGRGAQAGHSASTSFYYGSGEGPSGGGTYVSGGGWTFGCSMIFFGGGGGGGGSFSSSMIVALSGFLTTSTIARPRPVSSA